MRAKSAHQTLPELFGSRVGEVRKSRGLSQGELAKLVKIDRTTLNKIERGSRGDVSISQLFAFAAALRISPLYLVTPRDGSEPLDVAPGLGLSAAEARDWIRGAPLPGTDPLEYFLDLPREEQRLFLEQLQDERLAAYPRRNLAFAAGGGVEPVSEEGIDRFIEALEALINQDEGDNDAS
jgi:transcriptional regulator with XRE-family HTH domain